MDKRWLHGGYTKTFSLLCRLLFPEMRVPRRSEVQLFVLPGSRTLPGAQEVRAVPGRREVDFARPMFLRLT